VLGDNIQFSHKILHHFRGSQCCQPIKELGVHRLPTARFYNNKNDMHIFAVCAEDVTAEGAACVGKIAEIFEPVSVVSEK